MFDIILASHGSFSKGLLESVEFIASKQERIKTFSLYLGDDIETFSNQIKMAVEDCLNNSDEGVLLLTDIQSGSPFNACVGTMDNESVRHFTGMNMPMLLTVVCERSYMNLNEVGELLLEQTTKSIIDVNDLLKELDNKEEEEDDD